MCSVLYRQLVPYVWHAVRHPAAAATRGTTRISSVVGGRETSTSKIQSPQRSAELCFFQHCFYKIPFSFIRHLQSPKIFSCSFLRQTHDPPPAVPGFKPHLIVCVSRSAGQQGAGSDLELPLMRSLGNYNCKF